MHDDAWDEAARLVADAHAVASADPGSARARLELAGAAMVRAYEAEAAVLA